MLDPKNIIRSKRRTLALYVNPRGELIVKAPLNLPERKIFDFVKSKTDFILARQRQIAQNSYLNQSVASYTTFYLLGVELTPVISSKAKKIYRADGALVIPEKFSGEALQKKVEKWFKATASEVLSARADYFSARLKLKPTKIGINNNKTRWGCCGRDGQIFLNWRAVMLPPNLFDYIVVHEFCHLLEFNHTKAFWQVVETILPDWRTLRKHLKQMGWILMLFR